MAAPAVVPFHNIRPRFLEGFTPPEVKTILSAAKRRRYLANSVIVNHGYPADLFPCSPVAALAISMSLPMAAR